MKYKMRFYQDDAINAIIDYLNRPNSGNPLITIITGGGKTLIPAEFIRRVIEFIPNLRGMILADKEELVAGNAKGFIDQNPLGDMGIHCAGLNKKDHKNAFIYGSIGSCYKKAKLFGHRNFIFIDEAHKVNDKKGTVYARFISEMEEINPHIKVIGMTATPWRMGLGLLTNGKIFTKTVYDGISPEMWARMINEGHLCNLITDQNLTQINTDNIRKSGGEYVTASIDAELNVSHFLTIAVDETIPRIVNRKHILVFSSSVEKADEIAGLFNAKGVTSIALHGNKKTMKHSRKQTLKAFESGKYQVMVAVGIPTTGYNFPAIDSICLMLPIGSVVLYMQMVGRGLRPSLDTGKKDCLILDFGGNINRLGSVDRPIVPEQKSSGDGDAPFRFCEDWEDKPNNREYVGCEMVNYAGARKCVSCGNPFPPPNNIKDFTVKPSSAKIITATAIEEKPILFNVTSIGYDIIKVRFSSALEITYTADTGEIFKEVIYVEAMTDAIKRAQNWFKFRMPNTVFPASAQGFKQYFDLFPVPYMLEIKANGKYANVSKYFFYTTDSSTMEVDGWTHSININSMMKRNLLQNY